MRIRRLRVDGFGNLKGDFIFSSDRCNLILEPNESGKSTLAAAVLAALYGFPRERATRDRPIRVKEQHRPWSGGPYAIELEIESQERAFTVRRDFDRDVASVLDGRSGRDITAEFSRAKDHLDFGEALTGLSREDFMRCCFVGQRQIESLRDAASLTHALQRIASSQQGDVVAGEAIEAIARAMDRDYVGMLLGRGKVDTEIKRLDKEIDDLRAQLAGISARRQESEEKIRRLEEATQREGQVDSNIARVDYLCLLAARREVDAALRQRVSDFEELEAIRAEITTLERFASFPADRVGELRQLTARIESQEERRGALERRLLDETEEPLRRAEEALTSMKGFESLEDGDLAVATDRCAVLNELWSRRREKRAALRRGERRLIADGVDPARVTSLASALAVLQPDDRSFLAAYREKLLEVKAALSELERDRDRLSRVEGGESPALMSLARARRPETIALVAGVAGLALSTILFLSLASALPGLVAVIASLGTLLYWAMLLEKRPIPGAEEFGSGLQRIQTEIWTHEKSQAALQERLLNLASRTGYVRPDHLVSDLRELELLSERAAPVTSLAAGVQELNKRYEEATGELLDMMQRVGRPPARGLIGPLGARCFRDELGRYLEARRRVLTLRATCGAVVEELADVVQEIEKLRASVSSLLHLATGPGDGPVNPAAALALFEEAAAKKERYENLMREILPAAERRGEEPEKTIAGLSREQEVLSRQIERALKETPALEGASPVKSSREYAEERRQLQEESRRTQRERQVLSEELGDVLKEYRRDYPTLHEMLSRLESARRRAAAFRDAATMARDVLSAISREAYAEWAEVLNEKTTGILRRINPNYEDVRFDTDLSFTLRDARTLQRIDQAAVDAQFSAGSRDQIYLAVRLAAAEYLSAARVRLPFILDDPFATFDDDRFHRAMEFLIETLGKRHQIIVLSCHLMRHRRWLETASETLADRVRVLDLTPLSA